MGFVNNQSEKTVLNTKGIEVGSSFEKGTFSEPFKWIHFPIYLTIWFILFWVILCPVLWSTIARHWPYYYWIVLFLIFCLVTAILFMLWKWHSHGSPRNVSKENYDKIFLNPEYGDEKETLCSECGTFHMYGIKNCPVIDKKICDNCGGIKESFDKCCHTNKILKPSYDIVLRKQQPENNDHVHSVIKRPHEEKRNSLKNVKRPNSTSSYVISMHDIGTRELLNRNLHMDDHAKINIRENKLKKCRPTSLQPINIELANNYIKHQEQPQLDVRTNKNNEGDNKQSDSQTPKTVSISSMDSMDKAKFRQYLHLVEVNTPSSANDVNDSKLKDGPKSPLTPREIFFHDLIKASEKLQNTETSSMHFKFPNDKANDETNLNINQHTTNTLKKELNEGNKNEKFNNDDVDNTTKPEVRVIMTIRKETTISDTTRQSPLVTHSKIFYPTSNNSSFSDQLSVQDSLQDECVNSFFISNIKDVPAKPKRTNSSSTCNKNEKKNESVKIDIRSNTNSEYDDVFTQ